MQNRSRISGDVLNPKPPRLGTSIKAPRLDHGPPLSAMSNTATGFDQCVRLLEDSNNGGVADRIKFLGDNEDEEAKISEKSLETFTNILTKTKWEPPTSIGLNNRGMISASWHNPSYRDATIRDKCPGMATVLFPEEDGLFQLTAMFGDSNSDDRWVQVVGNLNESDTIGFLDSILGRFYK